MDLASVLLWAKWIGIVVASLIAFWVVVWPLLKGVFGKIWPAWVGTTGSAISVYADEIAVLTALGAAALVIAKHKDTAAMDLLKQVKVAVMKWDDVPLVTETKP